MKCHEKYGILYCFGNSGKFPVILIYRTRIT
jgi:hypothetical protein